MGLLFAHNPGLRRMPRTDYARSLIRTYGSSSDLERSQSLEIKWLRVIHFKIEAFKYRRNVLVRLQTST